MELYTITSPNAVKTLTGAFRSEAEAAQHFVIENSLLGDNIYRLANHENAAFRTDYGFPVFVEKVS